MNCILHSHFQRRASCACAAAVAAHTGALPQRLPRIRPIATTPAVAAIPAGPSSPDEPRIAQKKVKRQKRGPSSAKLASEEKHSDRMVELMARAIDAEPRGAPPASEEEMARRYQIGRNYVIGCFERHNEHNHDLAVKIRMKRKAMHMLPKEGELGDTTVNGKSVYGRWREEAMKLNDQHGPPMHRLIPMHTPPIEGFDPEMYMDMNDEDD